MRYCSKYPWGMHEPCFCIEEGGHHNIIKNINPTNWDLRQVHHFDKQHQLTRTRNPELCNTFSTYNFFIKHIYLSYDIKIDIITNHTTSQAHMTLVFLTWKSKTERNHKNVHYYRVTTKEHFVYEHTTYRLLLNNLLQWS